MKIFDHILVFMGSIETDARTLNMVHSLTKKGESVCVIGLSEQSKEVKKSNLLYQITLPFPKVTSRMFFLWIYFFIRVRSILKDLEATTFWGMDLYSLPVLLGQKKGKGKIVYDSREVYTALGTNHNHPIKQEIISTIERWCVPKVDQIFTSGPLDSKELVRLYDIPEPLVVMNLPRYFISKPSNKLREYFGISERQFIVLYQGMIHPGRGLKPFIMALPHMPDITLCILGNGGYWKEVSMLINNLRLQHRVFRRDPVPYDELPSWTASADFGLSFIEPLSRSLEFALPNKLFEYAQSGLPTIISALPQMKPIVEKYNAGYCLPVEATLDDWKALYSIIQQKESRDQKKKGAVELAKTYHWENQESTIYHLYDNQYPQKQSDICKILLEN